MEGESELPWKGSGDDEDNESPFLGYLYPHDECQDDREEGDDARQRREYVVSIPFLPCLYSPEERIVLAEPAVEAVYRQEAYKKHVFLQKLAGHTEETMSRFVYKRIFGVSKPVHGLEQGYDLQRHDGTTKYVSLDCIPFSVDRRLKRMRELPADRGERKKNWVDELHEKMLYTVNQEYFFLDGKPDVAWDAAACDLSQYIKEGFEQGHAWLKGEAKEQKKIRAIVAEMADLQGMHRISGDCMRTVRKHGGHYFRCGTTEEQARNVKCWQQVLHVNAIKKMYPLIDTAKLLRLNANKNEDDDVVECGGMYFKQTQNPKWIGLVSGRDPDEKEMEEDPEPEDRAKYFPEQVLHIAATGEAVEVTKVRLDDPSMVFYEVTMRNGEPRVFAENELLPPEDMPDDVDESAVKKAIKKTQLWKGLRDYYNQKREPPPQFSQRHSRNRFVRKVRKKYTSAIKYKRSRRRKPAKIFSKFSEPQ